MRLTEFLKRALNIYGNGNTEIWRRSLGKLISIDRNMVQMNRGTIILWIAKLKPANKLDSIKQVFSKLLTVTLPMNRNLFERWQNGEIGFEKAWRDSIKMRNL